MSRRATLAVRLVILVSQGQGDAQEIARATGTRRRIVLRTLHRLTIENILQKIISTDGVPRWKIRDDQKIGRVLPGTSTALTQLTGVTQARVDVPGSPTRPGAP
jgi:hypothetical protein